MVVYSDKVYILKDCDEDIEVLVGYGSYSDNDSLAVMLMSISFDEVYGVITVNIHGSASLPADEQFVDENNYPGIGLWLEKNGLARNTGRREKCGFAIYHAYKFVLPGDYIRGE